ncbi:MFS transporter [Paraburkholderia caribensis]|uniref:MFS transporter n=1 Tax=Paraburkholderia TaxID=1822464 RepID=UPI001CC74136|nr:MFS transporter [Paraburkholderia caribensis]BEU25589.1 MFS transporter [Paraburkholderia sp. 22B1P]
MVPVLFLLWLFAWVDRGNVAFAKFAMMRHLGMNESDYGLGAGLFFAGYVLFAIPAIGLQERYGIGKVLGILAVCWGCASTAMGLVSNTYQFFALRFLLGAFEAGFYPGVVLYFSKWFSEERRTRNFSVVHSAAICAPVLIGLSGAELLNRFDGLMSIAGWRWMFMMQALPVVLLGLVAIYLLPNTPDNAKWLTPKEKQQISDALNGEDVVLGKSHNTVAYTELLRDDRVWILSFIYLTVMSANAALAFFTPTLLKEIGYLNIRSIGYLFSCICLVSAVLSVGYCWLVAPSARAGKYGGIAALSSAVGLVITVLLPLQALWGLALSLVLSFAGTGASVMLFWQLPKKYLGIGLSTRAVPVISSLGNVGAFFTPWMIGISRSNTGSFFMALIVIASVQLAGALMMLCWRARKHQQDRRVESRAI